MNRAVAIADLALQFARINRATFHPDGVRPESDADHSIMLALLAMDVAERNPDLGLNPFYLCTYAVLHDLPEVYAGDTDTMGGLSPEQKADKVQRETAALDRLRAELGPGVISRLIGRYEDQVVEHVRFIRYLDKITPKLTHTLNGNAVVRRSGHTVEWLRERHRAQGAELRAEYPEFAHVLGPLFDEACALSEAALAT